MCSAKSTSSWTVAKRVLEFERNMMSDLGGETGSGIEPREAALDYIGKSSHGKLIPWCDAIARHEIQKRAFDASSA